VPIQVSGIWKWIGS